MINYLRIKIVELLLAGLIFIVIVGLIPSWLEVYRRNTDPSHYLEIHSLFVPNFRVNNNPIITYRRSIYQEFVGSWTAEIQFIDDSNYYTVCRGSGVSNYTPKKTLPSVITLDWYMDKVCSLKPGRYKIETVWIIYVPGYPDMRLVESSNIFEVKV